MNLFYGWRIVGASALIQFLYAGLLMQAFGAYVAVLAEDRGWSKTALAGGAALQSLEGAVIGPVMGWMVDRWGARRIVQAGLVILGLGFMVLSRIETLGGFYVAIVLMAVGGSLCGYFPLTITVMHWFRRQRARALSTMGLGLSLGGLAVPLVAASMQAYGWRTTAFGSGVLLIVLGWPLAAMLRREPSEVGETVDGLPPEAPVEAGPAAPAAPAERSFTALEAVRTQAFWLLGLGHGCALLVVTAVNVHAISHMKEGLGYTVTEASLVITLMTVAQTAGMVLGALVGDRWNKAHIAAACMLMHMGGLLLLTFAVNALMLGAFAVVHGLAWGLRGPLMQAMRADYFGLQAIGMIMGLSAFIISLGQVAGPMVAGGFADATGNYRWGFAVLAVISGAGSLLFVFAKKPT